MRIFCGLGLLHQEHEAGEDAGQDGSKTVDATVSNGQGLHLACGIASASSSGAAAKAGERLTSGGRGVTARCGTSGRPSATGAGRGCRCHTCRILCPTRVIITA